MPVDISMQLDDSLTTGELQARQSHLCAQQNQGIDSLGNVLWCMESEDMLGASQHGFIKDNWCLKNFIVFSITGL